MRHRMTRLPAMMAMIFQGRGGLRRGGGGVGVGGGGLSARGTWAGGGGGGDGGGNGEGVDGIWDGCGVRACNAWRAALLVGLMARTRRRQSIRWASVST